ncbi:MAG TPA: sigma 54-interacting transcriptional regulator [Terriglobales bacterium]|nr:sigma 54-interacting transcriptional regulator [Terriglobales bacterium]
MMYQPEIERIGEELYFIAASPATRRLRTQAELLSQTDVPVLITGESGSGKTTAARLIHSLSIRSSFPFMRVKCAVLTSDLLENELFGYEHTSADGRPESTPGKFEQCAKGTILLEEFDSMPGAVQLRLLRLLTTGEFVRGGGQNPIRADVRVIAVCGDLESAAADKRVEEELFDRLSVFELRVPPLRDRHEEIPLLLGHLMNRLTRRYGVPAPHFSSTLLDACQHYAWPGNLRELENFAKRFLAHGDENEAMRELRVRPESGSGIRAEHGNGNGNGQTKSGTHVLNLHASDEQSSLKLLVRNAKGEAERGAIAQALEQTNWNRKAAARLLNVSYRALLYKIQEYHLAPPAEYARVLVDPLRQAK